MINVTKPFLPPKSEYGALINDIWERNWLTNNGPLVNNLELSIKEYLKIDHFLYVSNGTIALQIAMKALNIKGEVITTPFSYVATTSSIVWEGCTPIFVDIDPLTFNIDPGKIRNAITKNTSCILATHVYGNPCAIDEINEIAKEYDLKVIYDASHCFGVQYKGGSIFEYGDISTTSFHATKLFHTVEGGGVFSKDPNIIKKVALMRNFGHDGEFKFSGVGINGKNSEFHAAMGLVNLNYIDQIIQKRNNDYQYYMNWFKGHDITFQTIQAESMYNFSYMPVLFNSEALCEKVYLILKENNIYSRRYFYPLLTELDYVESYPLPIAKDISNRVLCLPLYFQLKKEEIDLIVRLIIRTLKYK
ncbi:DegT/DnrJ/EryC1/StrS family aminotransferase [Flammeovirga aprica]|uniref:DegT/DnrJ/EryC1/StrS family aminotransferase n=1 Tax=Flammeovirga aprica JL-4 TaxID=694437 RepID=A0A7X9RTB0_9BACT|nr:DegT/DnrJ/EryC1/StrS family aminotransferase [Flammeovirga aprica]NME68176.1 DegT/DnrJ/EryC1/StrS family aminotransferase [Flammeovirga aprica JL-4]